jgi:superfamily I DNA/RNA helicase
VTPERLEYFIGEQEKFAEATKELFESLGGMNAGQYTESYLDGLSEQFVTLGKVAEGSDYLYRSAGLLLARARELAVLNPTKTGKISYSKLKDELKRFGNQISGKLDQQRAVVAVYQDYLAALKSNGRYDFEDMINNVLGLLVTEESVRQDFQERYQYLLVDEYQDTNTSQNKLVEVFGSDVELPNIFVVGDDDQSIFRFQGASLENVVSFSRQYGNSTKIVSLSHNYRSQPTILKVADGLIGNNQFRAAVAIPNVTKLLEPGLKLEAKPIQILSFDGATSEYYWISRKIREMIDHGTEPEEVAVLGKTNNDLLEMLPFMKQLDVPMLYPRMRMRLKMSW